METKRLFLGVALPSTYRQALKKFRYAHASVSGLRWTPVPNLHLTTYFMGKVAVEMIPNLEAMIHLVTQKQRRFELVPKAFAFGPSPQRARMIWLRFHKHDAFNELVQRLDAAYQQVIPNQFNRKKPIPHVTLARCKEVVPLEGVDLHHPLPAELLKVRKLVLWESSLSPAGASYSALQQFSLSP